MNQRLFFKNHVKFMYGCFLNVNNNYCNTFKASNEFALLVMTNFKQYKDDIQ